MTVTFFGHKNTPETVYSELLNTITDLLENKNADLFYVGNQGRFDHMVRRILKMLSREYSHIRYAVVLAYLPSDKKDDYEDYSDTIFPDGLETVPRRFAIEKRNIWMVEQADIVVAYVKNSYGGAQKFYYRAKRHGKEVINLANVE